MTYQEFLQMLLIGKVTLIPSLGTTLKQLRQILLILLGKRRLF